MKEAAAVVVVFLLLCAACALVNCTIRAERKCTVDCDYASGMELYGVKTRRETSVLWVSLSKVRASESALVMLSLSSSNERERETGTKDVLHPPLPPP